MDDPSFPLALDVLPYTSTLTAETSPSNIQCGSSCSSDDGGSTLFMLNILKERNLLLKAALQMQDTNSSLQNLIYDNNFSFSSAASPIAKNNMTTRRYPQSSGDNIFSANLIQASGGIVAGGIDSAAFKQSFDNSYDIIRVGILKKQVIQVDNFVVQFDYHSNSFSSLLSLNKC